MLGSRPKLGSSPRRAAGVALVTAVGLTAVPLAIAIAAAGDAVAAAEPGWLGPDVHRALAAAASHFDDMLRRGFARQPAAMLAIAGAAAVPLVAIVAAVLRLIRRPPSGHLTAAGRQAGARPGEWQAAGTAWIEIENRRDGRLDIGEITRIGRSDDCDLALGDASVDHTHALIRRTSDSEFIIIDVSAGDGAGVAINGRRLRHGRLRDGDRIDLGAMCVVFHQSEAMGGGGVLPAT